MPALQLVGTLNRHGSLDGYDESSPKRRTIRARRVFCSNRNSRPGCGRTFSIWLADKIRRLSVTTGCLHQFLKLVVGQPSLLAALDLAVNADIKSRITYSVIRRSRSHPGAHA